MSTLRQLLFATLFLSLLLSSSLLAQPALQTRDVVDSLDTPWEILWGPDDWIWVTERGGRISRVNPETGQLQPLLTIPGVHEQSESGLLGMVLHPDFADSSYVFVVYNYLEGNVIKERLVRYRYNGTTLVEPFTLITNLQGNSNHDGSRLIILPDYTLLMTTGDAQVTSLSQNHTSLSGKILRMNLDGSAPADNPWPNAPSPSNLLYTTGHRNPQGMVRAPNGIIYSSEHGPNNDDEVNIILKGRNYGWPNVQGFCNTPAEQTYCNDSNIVEPIRAWTPTLAVAGLDYYDSPAIPEWRNSLLMVNLKESDLRVLKLSNDGRQITGETTYFDRDYGRLRDLCISPDGRVFLAVSNRDGRGAPIGKDDRIIEVKGNAVAAATIESVTASKTTWRPGDTVEITFTTTGTYNNGNIFTAQLSNFNGDFSLPLPIGVLVGTAGGMIRAQIPCDISDGNGFLVRVVSNDPAVTSSDNAGPITILPVSPVALSTTGTVNICEGDSLQLTASEGYMEYVWNNEKDSTRSFTVREAGSYSVTVRDSNGCRRSSPITIVRVIARPLPLIMMNGNQLTVSGSYSGYSWNRDGQPIDGATSSSYTAIQPGVYSVTVTNSDGCSGTSEPVTVVSSSVSLDLATGSRLQLYPHPAKDRIVVEAYLGESLTPVTITISDVNGAKVLKLSDDRGSGNYRREIAVGHLPAGAYLLQIEAGGATRSSKFVKE